jgi:hypothetical protein
MRFSAIAAAKGPAAARPTYARGCAGNQDNLASEFADLVFIFDDVERARPGISWTVRRSVRIGVSLVALFFGLCDR